MARDKAIQVRVSAEEYEQITANAEAAGKDRSTFLRERALDNGSAGFYDSQAKAERVAGPTGGSAPVVEPPSGEQERFIERRTKQLYGQGFTMRRAKSQAEREWREAHPDTEENE